MSQTRPASEQIRFVSSTTGEHILDGYMELVEKGGRTLYDILDDMWDPVTGLVRTDIFQFRVADGNLEYRVGDFFSPDEDDLNWTTISGFFEIRGSFSPTTFYDNFDLVEVASGDVYLVNGLSVQTKYPNEDAFIAAHTRLFDVSSATAATATAQSWASLTSGLVDGTDFSAKAYAQGGVGIDDVSGSAKDWATKTTTTVDGVNFSAKYWATNGNVGAVASNIGDIVTVASNIVSLQSFAQVYQVGDTPPASPSAGDLWYDTANQVIKVYVAANAAFSTLSALVTTDDLTEGSNLFFTTARVNQAIADTVTRTYVDSLGVLDDAVAMALALGG